VNFAIKGFLLTPYEYGGTFSLTGASMSINIQKNDLGEKIRSSLVCPMIALDILQQSYLDKKISDEMRRFLELAKEDIVFIADLSWKFSRGVRWNQDRREGKKGVLKI